MTSPAHPAEERCEILVIGAGPAGAAAALELARAGVDVVLADQRVTPRDKVCGDALIPDALAALEELGLREAVRALACASGAVDLYAPDGSRVRIGGEILTLPRLALDHLLVQHAVAAGARYAAPWSLVGFVEDGGAVRGARFEAGAAAGPGPTVHARLTLLATGASAAPLELAGLCLRRPASGFAVRQYVRNRRAAASLPAPCLVYSRAIRPGYGWIFPGPDATFNLGAGLFAGPRSAGGRNVRAVYRDFVEHFPAARELLADGEALGGLRGAPLRTALTGARPGRPGLLAVGEAVGTTYAFSGEGIGKAIASGLLAARLALQAAADGPGLAQAYADALAEQFGARHAVYLRAERWLARPAFANLLAARARRSAGVRRLLEALLAETGDPRALFSIPGLLRLLLA